MSELKRTQLYDVHVAAGATMVDFGGWEMPIKYPTDIVAEHLYTRHACSLFDVSHMGRILVDGQDVRDVTQRSLRHNIGIVQQDVFLFAGTVLDNIRYGRPDATEAEVIDAARRAEIYDDIMAMPDGFHTYVGERGVMLSGGQKQRVSIARIFLKNPSILILDEATSALDSVTEARIQSAFDELAKGRTTLIIAHRLSTIRSARRIIVVDENHILEEGTHEQLLAAGGEYAQLYNAQKRVV